MKKIILAFVFLASLQFAVLAQPGTKPSVPHLGRRSADPNCGFKGATYYNTSTDKYRVCTAIGTPGTWTDLGGASGITVGTTSSTGTANTLLKTNASAQVADATGITQPSGKTLFLTSQAATDEPLTVKGAAGQSGNLTEWTNSADTVLASVLNDGRAIFTAGIFAGTNIDFSNSSLQTVGNGQFRFRDSATNITSLIGGGAAVASAAALPVPTGSVFHVTGTTNITSITSTGFGNGVCITMIFDGILTLTAGNNLKMAGDFTTTANDSWSGCFDGTNWFETGRVVITN